MLQIAFPLIDPHIHGNEIWDKKNYNSVCVRDICEIFASKGGFCGWATECCQWNFSQQTLVAMGTKFVTKWATYGYICTSYLRNNVGL